MECLILQKGSLIHLNTYKKIFLDKFIKELKCIEKTALVDILYRGISFGDIFYKLSIIDTSFTKYADLADKLFMVGEKAKYFLHDIVEINPEDISNNLFEKIFDLLGNKK